MITKNSTKSSHTYFWIREIEIILLSVYLSERLSWRQRVTSAEHEGTEQKNIKAADCTNKTQSAERKCRVVMIITGNVPVSDHFHIGGAFLAIPYSSAVPMNSLAEVIKILCNVALISLFYWNKLSWCRERQNISQIAKEINLEYRFFLFITSYFKTCSTFNTFILETWTVIKKTLLVWFESSLRRNGLSSSRQHTQHIL